MNHGLAELWRALARWVRGWARMVHMTSVLLVLALSPGSWRGAQRGAFSAHLVQASAPNLPWFSVLSALISLLIIRIVVVTAVSYGLSQYALEMVVRVLVLELIPLTAALFVALRVTIPAGVEVAALQAQGLFDAQRREGVDPLRREVLPRVLAAQFGVLLLAAVSSVITLVLAYLSVYGFRLGGFAAYTHTVGQVFAPTVALVFTLKTLALALAVSVIPVASVLCDAPPIRLKAPARTSTELQGLVRLFLVILAIEAASLVGNYY